MCRCVELCLFSPSYFFDLIFLPYSQKSRSPFVTAAPVVPTATMASQCPIVPVPAVGVGVARTSSSVSPSPFAPPPALAPIAGPVSQSLPLPSSYSTAEAKSPDVVRAHPDQSALSNDLDANEDSAGCGYVKEHTSTFTSRPDDGEAGPGGNLTTGRFDTFTHDPPDQLQPRAPSRQVCILSRCPPFRLRVCIRLV